MLLQTITASFLDASQHDQAVLSIMYADLLVSGSCILKEAVTSGFSSVFGLDFAFLVTYLTARWTHTSQMFVGEMADTMKGVTADQMILMMTVKTVEAERYQREIHGFLS
jgi:hypothetical protein